MTPAEAKLYRGTTAAVDTFTVWDRESGEKITVDDRTYDEALHSLAPVAPSAPARSTSCAIGSRRS